MNTASIGYIGMDVDKQKVAIAVLRDWEPQVSFEAVIANEPAKIAQFVHRQLRECETVVACYEAGSCGFELYRQLIDLGVNCVVAAPGLIPRKPGDRIKTDRRDARKLAKDLRNGELTRVYVPTIEDEQVRDYLRLSEDFKSDLRKAKQRLLHFLLRHRMCYTEGTNWTEKHLAWIRGLKFDSAIARETLNEYLCHIVDLKEKCQRIAERIEQIAGEPRYKEKVKRLKVFKGVETLIALSFIVEVADFRRFSRAEQFMAFLGLVPSEHSSGGKRRVGSITKAGNSHLRRLLIEAAWQYRSYHPNSKRLIQRRKEAPAQLVSYANRAGRRLNKKYYRLIHTGKPSQVAATAVARELAGFLWGAMCDKVA
jgi:transposase